eukprot:s394_g18.t1
MLKSRESGGASQLSSTGSTRPTSVASVRAHQLLGRGLVPILMETSYYVGAEPKNAVQSEKFWRNRIDAEEGAAVRATAQSLLERSCPITGRRPTSHRSERTPRSALVSRGKEIAGSEVGDLEKARIQQTATPRLQTASSRISVATSFSAISCRSTVLSLELEIERERRQAAEKELEELRKKLAESQRQSAAASSQPSNSETSKPTSKRSSKSWR